MSAAPDVEQAMRTGAAAELEVVRVLLLLQGAILIANTVEAGLFTIAFSATVVPSLVATGAAAIAILVGRARLGNGARGRRTIYLVEGVIVAMLAVDVALALALTHQVPPAMAIVTRFLLPVCVVTLLGRIARETRVSTPYVPSADDALVPTGTA